MTEEDRALLVWGLMLAAGVGAVLYGWFLW